MDLVHLQDRQAVQQEIKAACSHGQPGQISFRVPQVVGGDRWLVLQVKVFTSPAHPPKMAGLVMDVTAQKQLETELTIQNQQERLIAKLAQQIQQLPDMDSMFEKTVTAVHQVTQVNRAAILKFQGDGSCKVIQESCDQAYPSMLDWVIRDPWAVDQKYISRYQEGRGVAIADIHEQRLQTHHLEFLNYFQIKAAVLIPLMREQSLWGLLVVHQCTDKRTWKTSTVRLLQNLATQLSIALHQRKLHTDLQRANAELIRIVYLDSLTQVANRRRFDEYLLKEWKRSRREQSPLAVIMCDIDYFKDFNDRYGHPKGDICLRQVAQAIKQTVKRPADLVVRYGGEEFAVILPNTDLIGAEQLAEKIRLAVRRLHTPHAASGIDTIVTLSLGVAAIIANSETSKDDLISQADRALYQAKHNGRDQVAIARCVQWPSQPDLGISNEDTVGD